MKYPNLKDVSDGGTHVTTNRKFVCDLVKKTCKCSCHKV